MNKHPKHKPDGRSPQQRELNSRRTRAFATHPKSKTLRAPRNLFREGTPGTMHGESDSSARALSRIMASGPVGLGRNGYRRVPAPLPSTNPPSAFPISFRELSPVHLTPLCPPLPADVLADGAAGTREFVFGGVQALVVQGILCSSSAPPSSCQRETGKDARPKAQSKKPSLLR